ncbi:MAG: hypothetical protein IJ272_08045 [Clostridia bacterium]|nr:hypothetical protein [Clostridia bacterium]
MIIRFTVHDNKQTDTIKDFCKHIRFDNSLWTHKDNFSTEDREQLIEFDRLFEKGICKRYDMTVKEWRRLDWLLDLKFNYYLKQIGKEELVHQKEIEVVPEIVDADHKGEYVFYFVEADKILIL